MSSFYQASCQGYLLKLKVSPGAARTEVAGLHGDRLKVRVAAPPEKGAANEELLAFLARRLGVSKKSVSLTFGAGSREKVVTIVMDLSPDLGARVEPLLPESDRG